MKLKYNFVFQQVGDFVLAITVGPDALLFPSVLKLNQTSAKVMDSLKQDKTREQLVYDFIDEFDVELEQAQSVVDQMISFLSEKGLIQ